MSAVTFTRPADEPLIECLTTVREQLVIAEVKLYGAKALATQGRIKLFREERKKRGSPKNRKELLTISRLYVRLRQLIERRLHKIGASVDRATRLLVLNHVHDLGKSEPYLPDDMAASIKRQIAAAKSEGYDLYRELESLPFA